MKRTTITMVTRLIAVKETTQMTLALGQMPFRNLNMSQPMVFLLVVV